MSYIDRYKTKILKKHLDFMGHVNNATYLQLLEDGRWNLYNKFGYTKDNVQLEKKGPIIVETNIKYRKEMLLGEFVTIETKCLEYSGIIGKMKQIIFKEDGRVSCYAKFDFCYFDLIERKLLPAQGLWKETHENMLNYNLQINSKFDT